MSIYTSNGAPETFGGRKLEKEPAPAPLREMPWDRRLRIIAERERLEAERKTAREAAANGANP